MNRFLSIVPAAGIALVLIVNLGTIGVPVPEGAKALARFAGLDQKWTLFAPHPPRETGWLAIPARLSDGTEVDLFTGEAVSGAKPALSEHRFSNQRWGRLAGRIMREPSLAPYRAEFARYLCEEWDAAHPENPVVSLAIYLTSVALPAPGEGAHAPSAPQLAYEGACPTGEAR